MRYRVRSFLSLLVLVSYLNGCTSWQVQTAPTSSVLTKYAGKDVRVTTADGQAIEIQQPTVSGDTVVGRGRDTTTVAIPLQEVREVAVKRTDAARTVLLIGGIGAVVLVGVALALCGEC